MIDQLAHGTLASLSARAETMLRVGYAAILLVQLLLTLPHARRFFVSESYGGYIDRGRIRDVLHTPVTARIVMLIWIAAALAICSGKFLFLAGTINLALARYFFIDLRWKSIGRGMGAPGHFIYWFAVLHWLLSLADVLHASELRALTVVVFRVDFAIMMLLAGFNKIMTGYARGSGFDLGLVNPWWSKISRVSRTLPANSVLYAIANHLAYAIEIACGVGLLIPALAPFAALTLSGGFVILGRMIKLSGLAEMVALTGVLYVFPNDAVDRVFQALHVPATITAGNQASPFAYTAECVLIAYFVLLLPTYVGLLLNLYARLRFPVPLQQMLDGWCKICGLVLWRVFTKDVIDFYVAFNTREYGRLKHVGELICLVNVFNTLKYHPNNDTLFRSRLLRYARSLEGASVAMTFTYVGIGKFENRFTFDTRTTYVVDVARQSIRTIHHMPTHAPVAAIGQAVAACPVPGSYAPH